MSSAETEEKHIEDTRRALAKDRDLDDEGHMFGLFFNTDEKFRRDQQRNMKQKGSGGEAENRGDFVDDINRKR